MTARHAAQAPLLAGAILCFAVAEAQSSVEALRRACDAYVEAPGSRTGAACLAFVEGFLAGARQQAAETPDRDRATASWRERAMRTRLGRRPVDAPRARRPELCLPDAVPLEPIVREFQSRLLADAADAARTPAEVLTELLRRAYPCPQ